MSWHPYERDRRLWTIYWAERPGEPGVLEFELTEPYCLDRDDWRDLQLDFLTRVSPPHYFLNISQLWSRLWPADGVLLFSKMTELHKWPLLLSAQVDRDEQPGKRKDFFWVMAQLQNDRTHLNDLVYFQNIDLENITWITEEPIEPWPTQLFEHNKAAWAWNRKVLKTSDLDKLVRRECWGMSVTHLGHLDFLTTTQRRSSDDVFNLLHELAGKYNMEIESTTFDQRPRKPGLAKALGALPGNVIHDGWEQLKARNRPK